MPKCEMCGTCCKLFLINLNEEEYISGKYRTANEEFGIVNDFAEAQKYGLHFLVQKEDGSCLYLTENKCGIHEIRPQVCRNFFCKGDEPEFEEMRKQIQRAKGRL